MTRRGTTAVAAVRTLVTATVLSLTACTATAPTPAHKAGGVLRIGMLAPLTGASAVGAAGVDGAKLAVSLVNDNYRQVPLPLAAGRGLPHLAGTRLVLRVVDTRGDPERGMRQSARLITADRVRALVSTDTADVTAAAGQRSERLKSAPMIAGNGSADYLTALGLDWLFRVGTTDRMLGQALFSLLNEQARHGTTLRRLALVQAGDTEVTSLAQVVRQLAAGSGYRIVASVSASADHHRTAGDIRTALKSHPDLVVVLADTPTDATALVDTVGHAHDAPPVVGLGTGFTRPRDHSASPSATSSDTNLLRVVGWSADLAGRNRAARAVSRLYADRYGTPMTAAAADAFTAVWTLAMAADQAGSTDPDRLRSALVGMRVPGRQTIMPWDGIQFGPGGQNTLAADVVEQCLDGRFRVVAPAEIASAPPVWKPVTTGAC